jgi:hypothetical protein
VTALRRNVLRFQPATGERLDALAKRASRVLRCEVSRAAVVRAAVGAWLASSENADPAAIIEAIRASVVKRGSKGKAR